MVPHPVMLGFVNGLAIVIGLAQLKQFQIKSDTGDATWMYGSELIVTLSLVAFTMIIIWITPKLIKSFPAPLAAIGLTTAIVITFNLPVLRVGDLADISGGLPSFYLPQLPLSWSTLSAG